MAPRLALLSFIATTFLLSCTLPATTVLAQDPVTFIQEPEENYYILKKQPAVITCTARNAVDITFTCNGVQIPPTSVEREEETDFVAEDISASIRVSRADIINRNSQDLYWCECSAVDADDVPVITSSRAYVTIAYLRRKFEKAPMDHSAVAGENAELVCEPPIGEPKPEILWRKDDRRVKVDSGSRFIITETGNLVIQGVQAEDAGLYECVAKNLAGRRTTEKAKLTVTVYVEAAEAAEEQASTVETQTTTEEKQDSVDESKPRTPRQSTEGKTQPKFFVLPQESYYVSEGKDLQMTCSVVAGDTLTFRCGGNRIGKDWMNANQGRDENGQKIIQGEMTLPYAEVEKLFRRKGKRSFSCTCVAWFRDKSQERGWNSVVTPENLGKVIQSSSPVDTTTRRRRPHRVRTTPPTRSVDTTPRRRRPHRVRTTPASYFLDRAFLKEPEEQMYVGVGTDAILSCEPPKGEPRPWIRWHKDDEELDLRDQTNRYELVQGGSLRIRNVDYSDSGQYHCVAVNYVSEVESRRGRLIVTADAPSTTTQRIDPEESFKVLPPNVPDTVQFHTDLEPEYFLGADGSVDLTCSVFNIESLVFECNRQRFTADKLADSGKVEQLSYAKLKVTAADLPAQGEFKCKCLAWYLVNRKWESMYGNPGVVRAQAGYIDETFRAEPSDTRAYYGEESQLECLAPEGRPAPNVFWLKDGRRLDVESDGNLELRDGSLVFLFARVDDEGQYTCVAENSAGRKQSATVRLFIEGKPTTSPDVDGGNTDIYETTTDYDDTYEDDELDEPMWMNNLTSVQGADKMSYKLNCLVVFATNLWFECNGRDVEQSKDSAIKMNVEDIDYDILNNTLVVTVDMLNRWDSARRGDFVCRCVAKYKIKNTNQFSVIRSQPATVTHIYMDDVFRVEPEGKTVSFGESVHLRCDPPRGNPEPQVLWLKDGVLLTDSNRVYKSRNSLVIRNYQESDMGEYTCVANSTAGYKTAPSARLVTFGSEIPTTPEMTATDVPEVRPEITYPSPVPSSVDGGTDTGVVVADATEPFFSMNLPTESYATKNTPATLTCQAQNVQSIRFICNGAEVQAESTATTAEVMGADGQPALVNIITATYKVSRRLREPYNIFRCLCEGLYRLPNGQTDIIISEASNVDIAFLKKKFPDTLRDTETVKEGEVFSVTCTPPMGNPPPKVSWEKDNVPVSSANMLNQMLVLPNVKLSDAGGYRCVASNPAGERRTNTMTLIVEEDPDKVDVPDVTGEGGATEGGDSMLPEVLVPDSMTDECDGYFNSNISLDFVCKDVQRFTTCKFNQMMYNNIMETPKGSLVADIGNVAVWIEDFCSSFFTGDNRPFDYCKDKMAIEQCDMTVRASYNSTFWCKTMFKFYDCAHALHQSCGLNELGNNMKDLLDLAYETPCEKAEEKVDGMPVIDEKGEADPDTAESRDGGGNTGSVGQTSILASLLSVFLALMLSWR